MDFLFDIGKLKFTNVKKTATLKHIQDLYLHENKRCCMRTLDNG